MQHDGVVVVVVVVVVVIGFALEVSTNAREYTASGVRFDVVWLVVHGVAPWSGPVLGGTVVSLTGSCLAHTSPSLRCRFFGAAGVEFGKMY